MVSRIRPIPAVSALLFFFILNLHYSFAGLQFDNKATLNIVLPGEIQNNGRYSAARLAIIKKVEPGKYLGGSVHIKLKKTSFDGKNGSAVFSSAVQASLAKYNIINMRGLVQGFVADRMLEDDQFGLSRIFEVHYSDAVDPYDVCADLLQNPDIEYACPVFIRHTCDFTPNDPSIGSQWDVTNMKMKQAWGITKGDSTVTIAIVDSGVDWKHEDLLANIWTNPKEIDGNKIDDDGNGKIDDVHGWDLVGNITYNDAAVGNWKEDNDPTNIGGYHGTHVAGCASAVTNNGKGVAGIGFNCRLIPVKCAIDNDQNAIFRGYDGILYAASVKADIINCSWGGPGYSPAEQDVIDAVTAKGCLVVVAAGNNNQQNIDEEPFFPAAYNNVLCVGATSSNDKVAGFSDIGYSVTVYTPGENIYATMPNKNYGNLSGTSMASPNTSGLAGLVKSVHKDWSPRQILHQIRSTSDNVVNTDPTKRPYFFGRSNAFNAVAYNTQLGTKVPGVEISDVYIASGSTITSFDTVSVTLKVKNYLYAASDLKITLKPQANCMSLSQNVLNAGYLDMNQEKTFDIKLKLSNMNPWYSGYANIFVTFESGSYTDYQLLKIPVVLSSKNVYSNYYTYRDGYGPDWTHAIAIDENSVWACGNSGAAFQWLGGAVRITNATPQMGSITGSGENVNCVEASDMSKAFFGTGSGNGKTANILYTPDGGNNWNKFSVASITGNVIAIHFFTETNGIFLGTPLNNKFGIGVSDDAGLTWKAISTTLTPNKNESMNKGAAYWLKTYGWFGTNQGRIFRTTDMGYSWKVSTIAGAATIDKILFKDANNGIAIYSETTDRYAPKIVASSTDGGSTWTPNQFNFGAIQLTPVYIYSNDQTNLILMLCSSGQLFGTTDNGRTWNAILSSFHGNIQVGAGVFYGKNKIRVWDFGDNIGYLDFSFVPKILDKQLQLTTSLTMNYDSVDLKSSKNKNVTINASGNFTVTGKYQIVPASGVDSSEFSILSSNTDFSIDPDLSNTVRVKFAPMFEGKREATLKILSDAKQSEIDINLVGYGRIPTEVSDQLLKGEEFIKINPNPSKDITQVNFFLNCEANARITLIDLSGREIKALTSLNASRGWNSIDVDFSGYRNGMYLIEVKAGEVVMRKKFMICK